MDQCKNCSARGNLIYKEEFENIICDLESALYSNETTKKSILENCLNSIKCFVGKHFA